MRKEQADRAFELAETWINGNKKDTIEALEAESKRDPIMGIDLALKISAALSAIETRSGLQSEAGIEFQARIDRIAGERA